VLVAGAVAGTLDILAAFALQVVRGAPPVRVLQAIASGVLGRSAYDGGAGVLLLGLLLHYFIATGAAAVFYAASRWWPALVRHAVPAGIVYGVVVYAVMSRVVLPLSRGSFRPSAGWMMATMIAIHIVCVGLPIALAVRRYAGVPARA
jgi:hypothetical protein